MNMSYTSNETSDDDLVYIDGKYYRTDDDDVFCCEHCGEYNLCRDAMSVNTLRRHTEIWCKDCADKHAFQLTISVSLR